MKKRIAMLMGVLMCVCSTSITGCSASTDADVVEEATTDESETEEAETEEAETEEPTEAETEEVETEEPTEAETEEVEKTESTISSSDWVNLDALEFEVNGKIYTVGKTTLQEMIDDGVPFDEDDLANAGNNLNGNSESQNFGIVLGEYHSAYVSVGNYTDENATISDCVISQIYYPVNLDKEQDILAFAFPLDMTEDELLATAGEPSEIYEWESDDSDSYINKYYYQQESTVYYGDWGYTFEFMNGELDYVTIDWLP